MIINPITAITNGWISHPDYTSLDDWKSKKLVNPNAIDFTLDKLFKLGSETAIVTESVRKFREVTECDLIDGNWILEPRSVYDGMSTIRVNVPDDVACILINRSTFNRCGVHLNSGLYDTAFQGNIGFTLTNRSDGQLLTQPGTRVGQIAFVASSSAGKYQGIYNESRDGVHWTTTVENNSD